MILKEVFIVTEQIIYRSTIKGEEEQVIDLVLSVFDKLVAPEYSNEGITEFRKYAGAEALAERLKSNSFVLIAESDENLIGMIEIRDNSHVAMFFVSQLYQKMGIGKTLLKHAVNLSSKNNIDLKKITVNSSPNSVAAYEKMGFCATDVERTVNGIRHTPMELKL